MGQPQPRPLPPVPEKKMANAEKLVNLFLIAFLGFMVGYLTVNLKDAPDATDAAEEAISRVIRQDYVDVANETLLAVVQEKGLCDTIEATE